MKTLITLLAALSLVSCASVRIDLVVSEYTPPDQYCYQELQGEISKTLSSHTMHALLTRDDVIYFIPKDELELCD
jgi:hypothetical protein